MERRKTVVLPLIVMVVVGYRGMRVLMRGWTVVVLRMIVPKIFVYVQGGP